MKSFMKQSTKALLGLGLAAMLLAGFALAAWADCPTEHRKCYADAGKGAYLGKAACPTCWQWKKLACEFCWGEKEPASRCNSKYPACKGNCWSCDGGRHGCCLDKDGNSHGPCGDGFKKPKTSG
jgi:hypothetical protein